MGKKSGKKNQTTKVTKKSEVRGQKSDKKKQTAKATKAAKDQVKESDGLSVGSLEVVFERVALLEALKLASLAAAKSCPKYILKHVLIVAAGGDCRVRATDLEVALDVKVPCKARTTGTVALPAAELTEAVARSDDDEVTLRAGKKYIELVTTDGKYQFNIVDSTEFPTTAFGLDIAAGCELKLADLQAATAKVLHAVSKEATRYAMNGVLWEPAAGGLALVATDGRRLARAVLKTKTKLPATRAILSKRTAGLLAHLEADSDTKVGVEFGEGNIFLVTDKVYFCGLVLAGNYPAYNDVIPAGCLHSIELDAAAVTKQVQRAKILEGIDDNVRNVTVSSENGELLFDSRNPEVGKAEMRLAVSREKDADETDQEGDFEISVRSKYLLDALKTLDKFRLEVNDSDQPLVLADESTTHVIMPVNK